MLVGGLGVLTRLQHLSFGNNFMPEYAQVFKQTTRQCGVLARALGDMPGLRSLCMADSLRITRSGLFPLAAVAPSLHHLEHLELGFHMYEDMTHNEVVSFFRPLMGNLRVLRVSPVGNTTAPLAEVLRGGTWDRLTDLELVMPNTGGRELPPNLAHALRRMPHLQKLVLEHFHIPEGTARDMQDIPSSLQHVRIVASMPLALVRQAFQHVPHTTLTQFSGW
jgi:hypothetical protein